jgi:deoxycytidylate deaminase
MDEGEKSLEAAALDAAVVLPDVAQEPPQAPDEKQASTVDASPGLRGKRYLYRSFNESELVIGLVAAVGTDLRGIIRTIEDRLEIFNYKTRVIKISKEIIPEVVKVGDGPLGGSERYRRTDALMTAGDEARERSLDTSILALGVVARIASARTQKDRQGNTLHTARQAYIIDSIKHPDEVTRLREVYPESFYLLGVHADESRRIGLLTKEKRMTEPEARLLLARDEDEHVEHGQKTSDTFQMSDFFVRLEENADKLQQDIWRIIDVLFGNPYITPLFDEFAMFMAFAAALRSADLSRQVGAVVANNEELLSTGANDCPRFGGGLYWPFYDGKTVTYMDREKGRDYTRGVDSNKDEQNKIIQDIINSIGPSIISTDALRAALKQSRIKDITEYGRIVHAEMEAILSCARNNISCRGATLYCTTFPCHNCAKHIVAAGIVRVAYIEPYPKSKATEFHEDSLVAGFGRQVDRENRVYFEPFVGVGPRRFFDLFSMKLGSGHPLKRKDGDGRIIEWRPEEAHLRLQLLPLSYLRMEPLAAEIFAEFRDRGGD